MQVYKNTFELLDCYEFRHFWIRWYGGHIEVGSGEIVGMDLFMSWRDETPIENIRHVSLSTGYDNSGEYEISQNQGELSLHFNWPIPFCQSLSQKILR